MTHVLIKPNNKNMDLRKIFYFFVVNLLFLYRFNEIINTLYYFCGSQHIQITSDVSARQLFEISYCSFPLKSNFSSINTKVTFKWKRAITNL